jgi:DNA transformation protein
MPIKNPFVEYLLELLQPTPGIAAKRMFGGYGLFREGLMFGLVADDVLYLKVDDQNRSDFIARGLEPFIYIKDGKPMAMSYHEALDNADEMIIWAEKAFQAAVRAKQPKTAKRAT